MLDFNVIKKGEQNGEGTVFRLKTSKGTEIYGLPTANHYSDDIDLGPTWNYLIIADDLTLVDTGRWGEGKRLLTMIADLGYNPRLLNQVIITHGHDDHDGGLSELMAETNARLLAHETYARLKDYYPDAIIPPGANPHFPASCWHCEMPKSFWSVHCLDYHQERSSLIVHQDISDGLTLKDGEITFYHVPGHTPDSLAMLVDSEVLICGDVLLPEITPHPTLERHYLQTREVLPDRYGAENTLYGLKVYLKSIKRLCRLKNPNAMILPGHRLYTSGKWNRLHLKQRAEEIVQHHLDRCVSILSLIHEGKTTLDSIVEAHFDQSMLNGTGSRMLARDEILSHLELLHAAGDIRSVNKENLVLSGTTGFEELIRSL
jgi:glyoxylase-like metal-dependent hydrolase (beta-lactamase superfamily II)